MFKKNLKYFIFLFLVFAGVVYVQLNAPQPLDWNKTYRSKDKTPFGCSAFYEIMEESVFERKIEKAGDNIYNTIEKLPEGKVTATIFVNDNISFDDIETKKLLRHVSKGNKVLLAASTFNGLIADTLNLKTNLEVSNFFDPEEKPGTPAVIIYNPLNKKRKFYNYSHGVPSVYFSSIDTSNSLVIATDAKRKPVFVSYKVGKGIIYAISTPEVFANYNFAGRTARNYVYTVLSYIDADFIRFDEYYKTYADHIDSEMAFIFRNDSLYAAYILTLLSVLLFMVFNLRRRQRPIPVITPPANSTLEFVEVIGNVYFNAGNHKIIAEEKINSFLEMVRSKFQVNTQVFTPDFLNRVAALSGISKVEIETLFNSIERIQYAKNISETQLIELNTQIEKFNKNNKR